VAKILSFWMAEQNFLLYGVIVGKAIYEGKISLKEALCSG